MEASVVCSNPFLHYCIIRFNTLKYRAKGVCKGTKDIRYFFIFYFQCGFKSIALSYAYKTTNHNWDIVNSATDISVRLIEHLYKNWPENESVVDVYSINVPLEEIIANAKVLYTNILQNQWLSGSCFNEISEQDELKDAERREVEIRKQEGKASASEDIQESTTASKSSTSSNGKRTFKWAPKFADVYKTVDMKGEDSNDGWVIKEGNIRYVFTLLDLRTQVYLPFFG